MLAFGSMVTLLICDFPASEVSNNLSSEVLHCLWGKFKLPELQVSIDEPTSVNWTVRKTDDDQNVNTAVECKMAAKMSRIGKQVRGVQSGESTQSSS